MFKRISMMLPRQRHPLPVATVIITTAIISLASFGCHEDQYNLMSTTSSAKTLSEADKAKYHQAADEDTAFRNIGKRILGYNPENGDKDEYIGLKNIADAMGFKVAMNFCNKEIISSLDDGAVSVTTTSNTLHPDGRSCTETGTYGATKYTFTDWKIISDLVEALDIPEGAERADGGSLISSDAKESGTPEISYDSTKKTLVVSVPEIVTEELNNTTASPQNLELYYKASKASARMVQTSQLWANSAGVSLKVGFKTTLGGGFFGVGAEISGEMGANYDFTYTKGALTQETTTDIHEVDCDLKVLVPAGCDYKGKIIATRKTTKRNYRAYLRVVPQLAVVNGQAGGLQPCYFQGNCDGGELSYTFGKLNGKNFVETIRGIAKYPADDTDWKWSKVASDKDHQTGGKSDLENAVAYWDTGDFSLLAMDFNDVSQSITECTAAIEVVNPSDKCGSSRSASSNEVANSGLPAKP